RLASGKGVLLLHELHRLVGDPAFGEMMDAFGRDNAGKHVTTAAFTAHVGRVAGTQAEVFLGSWLKHANLPVLSLQDVTVAKKGNGLATGGPDDQSSGSKHCLIRGVIHLGNQAPAVAKVDVSVENAHGEITKTVELKGPRTPFTIEQDSGRPHRIFLDKY